MSVNKYPPDSGPGVVFASGVESFGLDEDGFFTLSISASNTTDFIAVSLPQGYYNITAPSGASASIETWITLDDAVSGSAPSASFTFTDLTQRNFTNGIGFVKYRVDQSGVLIFERRGNDQLNPNVFLDTTIDSSNASWTAPSDNNLRALLIGGGGQGGSGTGPGINPAAGGGGGSGYITITPLTPSASYAVVIGAGGGGAGGTTTMGSASAAGGLAGGAGGGAGAGGSQGGSSGQPGFANGGGPTGSGVTLGSIWPQPVGGPTRAGGGAGGGFYGGGGGGVSSNPKPSQLPGGNAAANTGGGGGGAQASPGAAGGTGGPGRVYVLRWN